MSGAPTLNDLYERGEFNWADWVAYRIGTGHESLDVEYRIFCDESPGGHLYTYREYLESCLPQRREDKQTYHTITFGRNILIYRRDVIDQNKKLRDELKGIEADLRFGGIRYWAPSGRGAMSFLRDQTHGIKLLLAGNRVGKSSTNLVDMILSLIPTDPAWPIHSEYGVPHRNFDEPMRIGLCTYTTSLHVSRLWPELKALLPLRELVTYSGRGKKRDKISWERNPALPLAYSSSLVEFMTYKQAHEVFESRDWHQARWDEQGMNHLFIGANERTSTHGLPVQHAFSLTGHVVEGRPDTGAGSWINKLEEGDGTFGHSVSTHHMNVFDPPDWVLPEKSKYQKFMQWVVEPTIRQDMKVLREAEARIWGGWHQGSGLVYDEFSVPMHVIEGFKVPNNWSFYRGIDHAERGATVCLFVAMSPDSEMYLIDEFYKKGSYVEENVPRIVEQSGNVLVKTGRKYHDPRTSRVWDVYEERMSGRYYHWTRMDPRSFETSDRSSTRTIGKLYRLSGLHVTPAPAHQSPTRIPWCKKWLQIDYTQKHPYNVGPRGLPLDGRPKFYVFRHCRNFIREITSRGWKRENVRDPDATQPDQPEKKNDDTQNAWEYLVMSNPLYHHASQTVRLGGTEHYLEEDDDDTTVGKAVKGRRGNRGAARRKRVASTGY